MSKFDAEKGCLVRTGKMTLLRGLKADQWMNTYLGV